MIGMIIACTVQVFVFMAKCFINVYLPILYSLHNMLYNLGISSAVVRIRNCNKKHVIDNLNIEQNTYFLKGCQKNYKHFSKIQAIK